MKTLEEIKDYLAQLCDEEHESGHEDNVTGIRAAISALDACQELCFAYALASEDNDGFSRVEWEDVDAAHGSAYGVMSKFAGAIEDINEQAKAENNRED